MAIERISGERSFEGKNLLQIGMPMGGIGAGCICLNGQGGLQDFSIRNKPATSAVQDGHTSSDAAFAILHIKGEHPVTRLLEGPMPPEKIYDQGLKAQGYRVGAFEGLPRFERCTFHGAYPFGRVELFDAHVPLRVGITGFSPFIPLDDKNSGIPCAILEYTFANQGKSAVDFEFSYHLSHLAFGASARDHLSSRTAVMPDFGVHFTNVEPAGSELFGSAALGVIGHKPKIKGMWFRGAWFDGISAMWRDVSTGRFTENAGNPDRAHKGRNGGSVMVAHRLAPGQSLSIPVVIAWHFPNVNYQEGVVPAGTAPTGAEGIKLPVAANCGPECDCGPAPCWRPYYVSQWKDAAAVSQYVREHFTSLRARTERFAAALFSSTLPAEVIDAVSANLAILKSPTVLRQENGNIWAWEGCFADAGCCPGSCTHVWNYAQAMPNLFPALERTLREQELGRSMDERGHVNFRAALPDGPAHHGYHPAADGQLGGIMKLCRDWQISGDRAWLQRMYPLAKRSLDFCIGLWDPDHRGALFEPHHNTYDIEFWGPDGMCTSIYLGALSAAALMARELGHAADADSYEKLTGAGARFMDESLFDGEYYFQRVMWKELRDQSFAKQIAAGDEDDEVLRLLKTEGPKYQYGSGCLADGVIGAWMARIYGIDTPMTGKNVRSHLAAVFRHNFKRDLFTHVCLQRPGYAMGHEPGLLLCTWPRGGMPTLPFGYSDEVWTGIEYQVASHLIEEGLVKEGLEIVRAVRGRYDGFVRNPFNEYECGSYYARAMASYALLGSLSGFRYSAATGALYFGPKLETRPFTAFFSAASGFGTITLDSDALVVDLTEGELRVDSLHLTIGGETRRAEWKRTIRAGEKAKFDLRG